MTETADEARRRLVLAALILPVLCAAPVVPALSARAAEPEAPDEEEDDEEPREDQDDEEESEDLRKALERSFHAFETTDHHRHGGPDGRIPRSFPCRTSGGFVPEASG